MSSGIVIFCGGLMVDPSFRISAAVCSNDSSLSFSVRAEIKGLFLVHTNSDVLDVVPTIEPLSSFQPFDLLVYGAIP